MKQFNELKAKHPEAILLFRVGDFYETYDEDATKIGEIPHTLAGYFYNSIGKLEVIKIKNCLNYRLTTDEISYLIEEASKSQNKQN